MHKTFKVQCQNKFVTAEFMIAKQFQYCTTWACSCLHFVLQNTLMVQYQLVGSCVFACVKLCIYGQ